MHRSLIAAVLVVLSAPGWAEVEKLATHCQSQMCFHWWPKLPVVEGWEHDRSQSVAHNINALVKKGTTFADADVVMYAKAVYKPRVPEHKTLESLIGKDVGEFRKNYPGINVEEGKGLRTADGRQTRTFLFTPTTSGQWERVSYLEEGDFYMVFTASSRSKAALESAMVAYEALIAGYREKP